MPARLYEGCVRLIFMAACVITFAGTVLISLRFPWPACFLLAFVSYRKLRRWRGSGWSHGTARWASWPEMVRGGLIGDTGSILGRVNPERPSRAQAVRALFSPRVRAKQACKNFLAAFQGIRWNSDQMIRVNKHVHILTFAPTGRGKGVSLILPNLLAYPGSVVVTDPKGENWSHSAVHRKKKFRHRVLRLDPFGVCGPGSDTFNPLSLIDPHAADFLDLCRDLANMLVVRQGTEHEPHWNDSAEMVLTAFSAFVCGCESDPAKRHLGVVRALVSSPARFQVAVTTMQKSDNAVIQRLGTMLGWFQEKELASVLTTVQRHTQFLDSPAIATSTASSNFDPRELRGGNRSIYLIIPPDRLGTLAPLMRMWVGMIIRTLARDGSGESRPVLFLIDEAAHLGKIAVLEDAVTLMRGMGIRLWFFFQSLQQLKTCYGDKADVMLDNMDTQVYFGTNSYESAEAISRAFGEFTLTTVSHNETTGWSRPDRLGGKDAQGGSRSGGTSTTSSDIARRLIRAEEILCLDEDIALIRHRNLPPASGRLLRYYDAPEFRKGKTGKPRGLGFTASVMAILALAGSIGFATIAVSLPEPVPGGGNFPITRIEPATQELSVMPATPPVPSAPPALRPRVRRQPSNNRYPFR